jgi:Putative Flp pilus-assembly TadE/G-like
MDERGQATPLLAILVVMVGLVVLGLGRLGHSATDAARARTAADAAALAGAADGKAAADDLAEANDAELVRYVQVGETVEVTVRYGEARAVARAVAEVPEMGSSR